MSTFTALNIEPDTDTEDENDSIAELQIEEALKLYQTALKLHSRGPDYYEEAEKAYDALFESDIFKYPEAFSESKRETLPEYQDQLPDYDTEVYEEDETFSGALPQAIFIAYKNRGKFVLDKLKHVLSLQPREDRDQTSFSDETRKEISSSLLTAMGYFGEALERDDTDLELWRETARLGEALNSLRLKRFCLETAFDHDEEALDDGKHSERLDLERVFATEDYRNTLKHLADDVAVQKQPSTRPKKKLRPFLRRLIDPIPYLPHRSHQEKLSDYLQTLGHIEISCAPSWSAVGQAILDVLTSDRRYLSAPVKFNVTGNNTEKARSTSLILLQRKQNDGEGQRGSNSADPAKDAHAVEKVSGISAPTRHAPLPRPQVAVTRKRSSSNIWSEETQDGARARSKRLRARESESQAEDATSDSNKYYEDRLGNFAEADRQLFQTFNEILHKFEVQLSNPNDLRQLFRLANNLDDSSSSQETERALKHHFDDIRSAMETWTDAKSKSANGTDSWERQWKKMDRPSLENFLDELLGNHPAKVDEDLFYCEDITTFVHGINRNQTSIYTTALGWLEYLLKPKYDVSRPTDDMRSPYTSKPWTPSLKKTVVTMVTEFDDVFYNRINTFAMDNDSSSQGQFISNTFLQELRVAMHMSQSLFELHTEAYTSMQASKTQLDPYICLLQKDRVSRWQALTGLLLDAYLLYDGEKDIPSVEMEIRHLWFSTFCSKKETSDQEDMASIQGLRELLMLLGNPVLKLANNLMNPEISVSAIDGEAFKIQTKQFLLELLDPGNGDSIKMIENIVPVLEPDTVEFVPEEDGDETMNYLPTEEENVPHLHERIHQMAAFIDGQDIKLQLFLWTKLRDAYDAIGHLPKVVYCLFRGIEVVVSDLISTTGRDGNETNRQTSILNRLSILCTLLEKLTSKLRNSGERSDLFESLGVGELQSFMSVSAKLSVFLHFFVLLEDSIRVGQRSAPEFRSSALTRDLEQFRQKLRTIQVEAWVLQYLLVVEGMNQKPVLSQAPVRDRLNMLRTLHDAIGSRHYCKYADKLVPRLLLTEYQSLLRESDYEEYEDELSQLYFDLYGLKLLADVDDHRCPSGTLDRKTAINIVSFVMVLIKKISMKDLPKSELKNAIDIVHSSINRPYKPPVALILNQRIVSSFLAAPIDQKELFRCFKGVTQLSIAPARVETFELADKGWYFINGFSCLTKFRSQKRTSPGPTDDLDSAVSCFLQEIEHGVERWETWYRLAQVYDVQIDEDISWSSDKLTKSRDALSKLQRKAIHAYGMAISSAVRTFDLSPQAENTLAELYLDFGRRLYASSREPLSMEAFDLSGFIRHFSSPSFTMYKAKPFKEMDVYSVWTLASHVFDRSLEKQPSWM